MLIFESFGHDAAWRDPCDGFVDVSNTHRRDTLLRPEIFGTTHPLPCPFNPQPRFQVGDLLGRHNRQQLRIHTGFFEALLLGRALPNAGQSAENGFTSSACAPGDFLFFG